MDILTLEKKLADLQSSLERLLSVTVLNSESGNEELALRLQNCLNAVSNLQSSAYSNQSDIALLQQAIADLQSESGGDGLEHLMLLADSIMVSTDVRSDDSILEKIAKVGARINSLQSQINTRILPSDPYNTAGMTFSDYPPGTIIRTYDYFEKQVNLTTSNNLTFPEVFFCAEEGSEVDIKVNFDYVGSLNVFDMLIKVHLNNIVVYQEVVSVTELNTQKNYDTLIQGVLLNTETRAATVKVSLTISGGGKSISCSRFKAELIGPNAELINRPHPYNVQYIQGKYYVSDCSSGVAKTAEILASQMWNMESLTWQDTGIEAEKHVTGVTLKQYGSTYLIEDMVTMTINNNQLTAYSTKNDLSKTVNNVYQFSWQPRRDIKICLLYVDTNKTTAYGLIKENFSSQSTGQYNAGYGKSLFAIGFNLLYDVTDYITSSYPCIIITTGGEVIFANGYSSSAVTLSLGYGSFARAYISGNSTVQTGLLIDVYIKHYDKIIKKAIKLSGSTATILSTEVIGSYEDYFRGANNDYFVVKNGQLLYYKDPLPEE